MIPDFWWLSQRRICRIVNNRKAIWIATDSSSHSKLAAYSEYILQDANTNSAIVELTARYDRKFYENNKHAADFISSMILLVVA